MTMNKFSRRVSITVMALLGVVGFLGAGPTAQADLITNFTFVYGPGDSQVSTPWNDLITLPTLNLIGGSVQSVTFAVSGNFNVTNQITNAGGNATDGNARFRTEFTYDLSGIAGSSFSNAIANSSLGSANAIASGILTLADTTSYNGGAFSLAQGSVTNKGISTSFNSVVTTLTSADTDLSAFMGGTPIQFVAQSSATAADITHVNGEFAGLNYQAGNMALTVTYDYTGTPAVAAVPEPTSGMLLGLGGIIGLIGYGRQRGFWSRTKKP